MNKKKKLLLVCPYFPPHTGGLERYVEEITVRLESTEEWSVTVLTTSEDGSDCVESRGDVKIHRLGFQTKISNTPLSLSWLRKVRRVLKDVQPDMVNVHTPVPGLGDIASWCTPRATPLVVTYHAGSMCKGELLKDSIIWIYENMFLPIMLRKAKRIICSSDFVREDFLKRYMYKSATVQPATNTEDFTPKKAQGDFGRLIFVGGLHASEQHKGLSIVFKAIAELQKEFTSLQLTVVGVGDMQGAYEKMTDELGIRQRIDFVGTLYGKALIDTFQHAHVLVHPSSNDSSPTVIIEGMACGLPVVSTTVGGIPLLVDDGVTGLLVEPNNVAQFTQALRTLLENPDMMKAYSTAGRARAEERFSWKKRIEVYRTELLQALTQKKAVTHVVGYYPPHIGGMEIVAQEIAREQVVKGYDVTILTSSIGSQKQPAVMDDKGVHVRRIRSLEFAHTPLMWTLPYWLFRAPRKSVVHVHVAQSFLPEIALCIAKNRKMKFVAHFHLDVEPSGKLGFLFLLYKKYILGIVLRLADTVIVFSEEQKKFVHTTYGVKNDAIVIIPNGIDEAFLKQMKKEKSDTVRLLYVGRLTIQKRLERIIEAMPLLTFDASLTFVGDGEDRKTLETLAQKVGGNITFTGRKPLEEAREYFHGSDVFVIPSDKEGMPMVILEAMAAGVPIVASNVMGLREAVGGVGVLVRDLSPQGFAEALNTLVSNPERMLEASEKGRAYAKNVTWPKIVSKIEEVYNTV